LVGDVRARVVEAGFGVGPAGQDARAEELVALDARVDAVLRVERDAGEVEPAAGPAGGDAAEFRVEQDRGAGAAGFSQADRDALHGDVPCRHRRGDGRRQERPVVHRVPRTCVRRRPAVLVVGGAGNGASEQ
jgi:hypothetical protein